METDLGVVEGDRMKTYLRGEACQNIYLDYDNVLKSSRVQLPFGIAQIGKAYRNEVTPGNFLFRQREFDSGTFNSLCILTRWTNGLNTGRNIALSGIKVS